MAKVEPRKFEAKTAVLSEVPCLIGICGPPGGGKTLSSLRLAKGMQEIRPGPIVLIDTEGGRAKKYAPMVEFKHVEFAAPFIPEDFLEAVKQQLALKPAAIIVDSLSDEHCGTGGVLDWHDQQVPLMGGNEWAAWAKPKASRRKMMSGFLQIKTPLIFTFRAAEKTKQMEKNGKQVPVNIGYQPIAPDEIVYGLDLMCILPPRANGVPVWKSDKIGEDFIIKLPKFLQHCFKAGAALDERTGKLLAEWAKGNAVGSTQPSPVPSVPVPRADAHQEPPSAPPETEAPALSANTFEEVAKALNDAADRGMDALQEEWTSLHPRYQNHFKGSLKDLKLIAGKVKTAEQAPI